MQKKTGTPHCQRATPKMTGIECGRFLPLLAAIGRWRGSAGVSAPYPSAFGKVAFFKVVWQPYNLSVFPHDAYQYA
jgi:hypothetical protein